MQYRQLKLLAWVRYLHNLYGEPRKDGEEYCCHLLRVGKMAQSYDIEYGLEKGLCHDLIEDISLVTPSSLMAYLKTLNYSPDEALKITKSVISLTDVYTSEAYPEYNRAKRKELEAERLFKIPVGDQTIKYCDLIDNTNSIVRVQPDFAKVYLKEKKRILQGMNSGNKKLWQKAWDIMIKGEETLLKLALK